MTTYRYIVFGLNLESNRRITSLATSEFPFVGDPDVELVEGEVPVPGELLDIDGVKVNVDGARYFLGIEECGRFEVVDGRKIIIQRDPAASDDQVNLYLLGSVFGTLLHQRGLLPFHCNGVEVEGSAFLFCGGSGAGKSTLAAYFVERGFRLLGDDLCALDFNADGRLVATRGIARLKLWRDTLEQFGQNPAELALVPWYDDKFEIPLTGRNMAERLPVAGLFHLRNSEGRRPPGIFPVKGLEAANSITANIYRRRLADLAGAAPSYLAATTRIVDQVPIFMMNRTWGFTHFRDEALAVECHMRQLVREPGRTAGKGLEFTTSRPLRGLDIDQ